MTNYKEKFYGKPQALFDLHVHTTASDGVLSPFEIIKLATEIGLRTIAITDHDTIANVKECVEYGLQYGVRVIPGIEFSAKVKKGKIHILGLGVDYNNECLLNVTKMIRENRDKRNEHIIETLNYLFDLKISIDDVISESKGQSIGKPHIAAAIVKLGYAMNITEAFEKYLSKKEIDGIERIKLEPKTCIELIHNAGGIAVLAHPNSLELASMAEVEAKFQEFKRYGIDGIEAYHSSHTISQAEMYKKLATKLELIITCGSDFHGLAVKDDCELGYGRCCNIPTYNENYALEVLKLIDKKRNAPNSRNS